MGIPAAVIPKPSARVEVRELDQPEVERGGALLRVDYSEVCGTDVHLQAGRLEGVPYPLVPGHVAVGRLAGIRGRLRDVEGRPLREGDAITFLDVHRTCHACWYCLVARASTRCPERRVYGITYGVQDGPSGGWAEQLYLKPGTRCLSLAAERQRSFMAGGCSLPTALHAQERAEIGIGDSVLVLGSGPVGLSSIVLSRMAGASTVLCIGAPSERLEAARSSGADAALNWQEVSEEERWEWVRQHTAGRGADVTIEATGQPRAVVQAMRWTRDAGRVVIVGQYTDMGTVEFNPHLDLNRKHLEVRGCWGSDFSHFHRAVRIAGDETASRPWARWELAEYPLDQAQPALDAVAKGDVVKALIRP